MSMSKLSSCPTTQSMLPSLSQVSTSRPMARFFSFFTLTRAMIGISLPCFFSISSVNSRTWATKPFICEIFFSTSAFLK